MKIIFIGDPHGRSAWKKIIEKEDFNLVIFAGDYVSSHENISEETQIANLKDILTFKEENPDTVILLRGNHDLQHLGYHWAECSGLFFEVQEWMSQKENKERFLRDTQWVYAYNKLLFSHAGVSRTWLDSLNLGSEDLNDINLMEPDEHFGFIPDSFSDFSGNSITQSCVWIRPQALSKDAIKGYTQIVGHTPVTKITDIYKYYKKHIWLCDALPFEYLVIDGKTITPAYVDKEVLPLHNRYGFRVYFELIGGDEWLLKGDDNALEYIQVSFVDDHTLSVDPSGGPYLAEGELVSPHNKRIVAIKHSKEYGGYIFTLKDEGKEN